MMRRFCLGTPIRAGWIFRERQQFSAARRRCMPEMRADLTCYCRSFRRGKCRTGGPQRCPCRKPKRGNIGDGVHRVRDGLKCSTIHDSYPRPRPFQQIPSTMVSLPRQNRRMKSHVCAPTCGRNVRRRSVQIAQPAHGRQAWAIHFGKDSYGCENWFG